MTLRLPSSIKALIFDAYGTLFDVQSLQVFLEEQFGEKADAINAVWRQKQLQYTWLRSLMGRYTPFSSVTADALRYACQEEGLSLTQEMEEELVQRYYTLAAFEEVKESLARLSESFVLAVLSNADEAMLSNAVMHNRLNSFLSHVLSVNPILKYKPLPEVYTLPLQAMNLKHEEVAFISSNTWDVAGAKSFGLRVIWLNRYGGRMEELGIEADWVTADLRHIVRT